QKGGIAYIFLTHKDDVADAEKYAAHFGAKRMIHRADVEAAKDAEWIIDGADTIKPCRSFRSFQCRATRLAAWLFSTKTGSSSRGIISGGTPRSRCLVLRAGWSGGSMYWWTPSRNSSTTPSNGCWPGMGNGYGCRLTKCAHSCRRWSNAD